MTPSILPFVRDEASQAPLNRAAAAISVEPHFSVVIPVYGSAAILPELHRRLGVVLRAMGRSYEFIFVDDCGHDDAWQVLQGLAARDVHVTAVQLMRNSGQSTATLCGLARARGQFVITMDDDLQHLPEEIPRLIEAMGQDADVVMGVPLKKQHSLFRCLGSEVMHRVNSLLLGKDPALHFTSFRVLRRPLVNGLLTLRTMSPAMGPMINSITHRIRNVTVEHAARAEGRSSYTLRRLLSQTLSNLVGYSVLPLRLLGLIGAIGIVSSLVLAGVLTYNYLRGGVVAGWTSIAMLLLLLSGFNFFAFAIVGEYVLRILQRVNASPQYLVRSAISADSDDPHAHAQ